MNNEYTKRDFPQLEENQEIRVETVENNTYDCEVVDVKDLGASQRYTLRYYDNEIPIQTRLYAGVSETVININGRQFVKNINIME